MDDDTSREQAVQQLTELVLGAPVEATSEQAALDAGISVDMARPYWRAMGFPDVGDRVAFTRADVEALGLVLRWVDDAVLDESRALEIVRSLGQTTSRLADWQADMMVRFIAESGERVDMADVAGALTDLLPGLESLLVHAWRRHLAAVLGRALAAVEDAEGAATAVSQTGTVGFADIASFTRLARVLGEVELAGMVEAFETGASDIVAAHGGRVVKTLGDEVMFLAPDADAGVAIALAMHELLGADGKPLRLRIGLATGRLVALMGDYYGQTVNLASRLTAAARPGGTLVDGATEEALGDLPAVAVRRMRPRALRGMGIVRTASVSARREASRRDAAEKAPGA